MSEEKIINQEQNPQVEEHKEFLENYDIEKAPTTPVECKSWLADGIDKGILVYNGMQGTDASVDAVNKVYKAIEALRDRYNGVVKQEYLKDLKTKPEPLMAAIRSPFYKTVRIKDDPKEDIKTITKEEVERRVNPIDLDKFCGKTTGKDHVWVARMKTLWLAFIARGIFEKLPDDASEETIKKALTDFEDCDFMKEVGNMKAVGVNLTSNTKLETRLSECVAAMIGEEYSPKLKDVRYILQVYTKRSTKKGEENTVVYCKEKPFADIIMDVCRRIVCNIDYKDSYKIK